MTNSFNIYNASAGSGKTFTLVKEYLILLLTSEKKDRYKNILAITFTNKAVGEMKSRIIESLARFADSDNPEPADALLSAVQKETNLEVHEIKRKSQEILKSIIHNYAAFEISTIDGFTHRVLRTFARDLGIPMNFEVELETDDILMEAVESLISKAGKDKVLTKLLIEFTLTKADDDKSWDISRDLYEISKLLTNENNLNAVEILRTKTLKDFQDFKKQLIKNIKETEGAISKTADLFFDLISNAGIDHSDFKGKYIPNYFKKLKSDPKNLKFEAKWMEEIATHNLYPQRVEENTKSAIDSIQPEIAEIFSASKKAYFKIEFLKEIRRNIVQLSLLNEINREVETIKKERNILLISEFNPRIGKEVKDQPAPFIYERLGERYQHYFIDEFQDTSTMQWENLIPLIAHNLSGTETRSGLTIVGDAKQSIYRWRGGRAEQLIDLSQEANPFPTPKRVINLPDNYRSGSQIVNFNNSFFKFASSILTFPEYSELFKQSSQYPKRGEFGYVNLSFINAENGEEELKTYTARILEIIQNLDSENFYREDICILTRRKTEGVAVAEYLVENGIPVVSSESLLISQSAKVNFIIDILHFSLNPEDDQLKMKIFDFLADKYIPIENNYRLIREHLPYNGSDFFKFLEYYHLDFDLDRIKKSSVYEAVEYIIRSFDLVQDSDSYIQFFLDFVFETSKKTANNLVNLLEIWERKKQKLSIVAPETGSAVRIMTIHKSKGLEFPIVIYPFANSRFQDTSKDSLWIETGNEKIPIAYVNASSKMLNWNEDSINAFSTLIAQNELDTLNVLYVACTRASHQLYLLTNYHEKAKNSPNIPDLFKDYLISTGKWDGRLSYEFGKKPAFSNRKRKSNEEMTPKRFFSTPTQSAAVKIVTRSGALWDSNQQKAIEKGEIAHEVLSRINSKDDKEKAMSWAINQGLIEEKQKADIEKLISDILEHPDLKEYFKADVSNVNEKDILTRTGERLRPDRLNFEGKKVTIIDYKTGGYVDDHKNQISSYAEALSEMGYQIEKSLLIYTADPVNIRIV